MNTLKEMVQGGKVVKFQYYQEHELWYSTECGFMFPVPLDDTGNAVFKNEDKASFFMRWIRKHIDYIKKAQQNENSTGTES